MSAKQEQLEQIELDVKCNGCSNGHWIRGESRNRKDCSLGFDPETCDHDLDKFEDGT